MQLKANGWNETMQTPQATAGSRSAQDRDDDPRASSTQSERTRRSAEDARSVARSLRRIASDITGRKDGSRDAWNVKLEALTSEKIEAWRMKFIRTSDEPAQREERARVREQLHPAGARALQRRDALARSRRRRDSEPAPFAGIKVEATRVARYRATFDFAALIESARSELAEREPEQFKIFLLAAMVGLRRNEIDKLPWSVFRFDEGLIRIEATEHFRAKSHSSEGDVLVDPELIEIFRGFHARRKGDFVIESDSDPRSRSRSLRSLSLPRTDPRAARVAALARSRLAHAAAHAAKRIRLADQQSLWIDGSAGDAAPREHPHDRSALRREQAAIGPRLRSPSEERTAHDRRALKKSRRSNLSECSNEFDESDALAERSFEATVVSLSLFCKDKRRPVWRRARQGRAVASADLSN